MPSNGHYSSSSYQDESDDDLDALRKAALQTLNFRKRKVCYYSINQDRLNICRIVVIIHRHHRVTLVLLSVDRILHHRLVQHP